jgi:hypothetical protein
VGRNSRIKNLSNFGRTRQIDNQNSIQDFLLTGFAKKQFDKNPFSERVGLNEKLKPIYAYSF